MLGALQSLVSVIMQVSGVDKFLTTSCAFCMHTSTWQAHIVLWNRMPSVTFPLVLKSWFKWVPFVRESWDNYFGLYKKWPTFFIRSWSVDSQSFDPFFCTILEWFPRFPQKLSWSSPHFWQSSWTMYAFRTQNNSEVPAEDSKLPENEKCEKENLGSTPTVMYILQGCHHQGKSGKFLTFWKVRESQGISIFFVESQGKSGKMIWPRWPKVCPWFLGIFL